LPRCPITYDELAGGEAVYSKRGLGLISRRISGIERLPYSSRELVMEATNRAAKMSIAGIQPKLSAVFSTAKETFEIVDTGGAYILKPQHPQYPMLPENEDLIMKLARLAGIETPLHGMILTATGEFCYFTRRFDRIGRKSKLALEDFAQLAGASRDTKYDSSLERVAGVIRDFCTVPLIELEKLFRRVIFSFLIGNEDMHLKNYSLLTDRSGVVALSPAYDLVSSSLVINYVEESALPLGGRKSNWTRELVFDYFARERLALPERAIDDVRSFFQQSLDEWIELIDRSFLTGALKGRLKGMIQERTSRLEL
jgi:serine/threonine-protein kinase HipA